MQQMDDDDDDDVVDILVIIDKNSLLSKTHKSLMYMQGGMKSLVHAPTKRAFRKHGN